MEPISNKENRVSNKSSPTSINDLSPEVMAIIARHLDIESLENLGQTNRAWRAAVLDEYILPVKQYNKDFPEILSRVIRLLIKESAPKNESVISRVINFATSWFSGTQKKTAVVKESLPPYRLALRSRFLNELARICLDYDVPEKLYKKTVDGGVIIDYNPEDIDKIKSHIQQKNKLGLCQLLRPFKTSQLVRKVIQFKNPIIFFEPEIKIAEDDNDTKMIASETQQWRDALESLPLDIGTLEFAIGEARSPIFHLPPEIQMFKKMQRLLILSRNLRSLPPEIGNLGHLSNIVLVGNDLTSLPPEIGQLDNLKELIIENNSNRLSIPKEILNCKALKKLSLSGTDLTPESQEILKKLKEQNGIM